MVRKGALVLAVLVLCVGCSGGEGSHNDSPKTTCIKANDIQRKATAAETAASSGAANAQDLINELGGAVNGAVKGAQSGAVSIDLSVVANDVDRFDVDFKDNKSNLPGDIRSLQDSLIKLAMDCSQVLTG